uniref:Uncharacterized protein n=1 Tax=Sphaerodactylus townsendi TaxID=933632 RepID=A0ACB8GC20_9SAUR
MFHGCTPYSITVRLHAYQIVVEELHPHRTKRETGAMDCYQIPVTYHNALSGGSPYYFAAELSPSNLPEPAPFTVGDNRTYQGFWNPPLTPRKGYNIYFQAMSSVEKVSGFLLNQDKGIDSENLDYPLML